MTALLYTPLICVGRVTALDTAATASVYVHCSCLNLLEEILRLERTMKDELRSLYYAWPYRRVLPALSTEYWVYKS
jgi:hypothetical protein